MSLASPEDAAVCGGVSTWPEKKMMKFHQSKVDVSKGCSATLGKNGGFQRVGSVGDCAQSFNLMCDMVVGGMMSPEFVSALSRSKELAEPAHPKGMRCAKS